MNYEDFTGAMQNLKDAKNHLRAQRGTGDCAAAIARNQAINLLNDAEFSLTGQYARDCQTEAERWNKVGAQRTAEDIAASRKMSYRPKTIPYTPELKITNTQFLAPGLGLRYLEVIEAPIPNSYIAKCWHREFPKDAAIVIEFRS